jgi:hypothetical protein
MKTYILIIAVLITVIIVLVFRSNKPRYPSPPGVDYNVANEILSNYGSNQPRPEPQFQDIKSKIFDRTGMGVGNNMDAQYANPSVNSVSQHPVIAYQYSKSQGINPATPGDPIRVADIAGPISSQPIRPSFYGGNSGIIPMGLQVPMGSLKATSERYNKDAFVRRLPGSISGPGPFYGSVDAYAPFPEIVSPWEKAGLLTSVSRPDELLNLFRRAIVPQQDFWEYQVEDKNGFIIKLDNKYIEDGDIIHHIIGKQGLGPWKAHVFIQNKYVWV